MGNPDRKHRISKPGEHQPGDKQQHWNFSALDTNNFPCSNIRSGNPDNNDSRKSHREDNMLLDINVSVVVCVRYVNIVWILYLVDVYGLYVEGWAYSSNK